MIMDNLGSHKGKAVRLAIRKAGAHLIFLPSYSPDLNPIEQVFAKLKTLLRKADERSVEATWRRIGALLNALHSERVRQLSQKRRLCFHVDGSDPRGRALQDPYDPDRTGGRRAAATTAPVRRAAAP